MNSTKIYALIQQALKQEKAQARKTAKDQLVAFMKKKTYALLTAKPTTYTRKDGKTINVEILRFSNNKEYMCSNAKFWSVA